MADGNLVRLGGIFGLISVVAMIPAYLVGYPDAPGSPEEAGSYFEAGAGTFVFSNGVLPLFHTFFFILFLGVLYGLLRGAQTPSSLVQLPRKLPFSVNSGNGSPLAPIPQPPIRDSSRSRSRWMRRMTSGEISPRSRRETMVSLSAASSSRRQFRQLEELSVYS
jgi:hypothetical protein